MITASNLPQVPPTQTGLALPTPESQLLATVRAATTSALARGSTPELREMLADMSVGLTKAQAVAAPKIFQLNRTIGPREVVKLLVVVLRAFVDSIRVPDKPDAADLIDLADTLAQTYTHDSIKDILLALREARLKGTKFYQALDTSTIYRLISEYFEAKARFLENQHLDHKATGPGQDAATVAGLAGAGQVVAAIISRRLDPAHPNRENLRRKLTITKGREAHGLITAEQAEQQRQEVQAANYHHATRRQQP